MGLNQFTTNGATITGLIEVDLNSPEPDGSLYVVQCFGVAWFSCFSISLCDVNA